MAIYRGLRVNGVQIVTKDGVVLSHKKSCRVWNHSPDGPNWGYAGSGPAQLALMLLMEETSSEVACALHQRFKRAFVVAWRGDTWSLSSDVIQSWLALAEQEEDSHV